MSSILTDSTIIENCQSGGLVIFDDPPEANFPAALTLLHGLAIR
ncbi:MAG: hypothetical protein ABIR25_06680 [Sphingomicrobium sp.]